MGSVEDWGKWIRELFPVSSFLPVSGESGARMRESCFQLHQDPEMVNGYLMSSQGPQCGTCSENTAKVVFIVLRCCMFLCSKVEEIPAGDWPT